MYTGENPGGNHEIFYSRSTNSGISFSNPTILTSVVPASTFAFQSMIAVDGSDVTLLFLAEDGGGKKQFSQLRISNNGATFSAQQIVYDGTTCEWDESEDASQNISIDGRTIVVTCAGIDNVLDSILDGNNDNG